ncbi:hypothetical protein [Longimicrobium sp.]|uniref:hypothetical protein n=1 Tax=Longimicrobium sp. TaxID=2029185 RepID=UPI0032C21AD9
MRNTCALAADAIESATDIFSSLIVWRGRETIRGSRGDSVLVHMEPYVPRPARQ